ncbi:signal peptidase I [Maricaulis sp.]|uniref:signal peptidase I n=1 Tax=Maricaulis sp. TaxID=1486257 RepID=UPI00261E502B|nr:signal peptidase I [Maricaulis sp.]MDF1769706.1 signal peptidase I [Maricaulis sp.]
MLRWFLPFSFVVTIGLVGALMSLSLFRTPSESMMPTVQPGDRFVVNKWAYGYNSVSVPLFGPGLEPQSWLAGPPPQRGDVIVFLDTNQVPQRTLVARVVAIGGDEVAYRGGRLILNGETVPRELIAADSYVSRGRSAGVNRYRETLPGGHVHEIFERSDEEFLDQTWPVTVPEGRVFLLGDNRDSSRDSRAQGGPGMVPLTRILGRVSN